MVSRIPTPTSKFLKVKCLACKNEQVIFGSASREVACSACGKILAEPSGGKSLVNAKIVQVLG
ncbi:MAG TPA: 30S ribosomal protein S27e [archaeon]|nr:30S ribosomal protein S27e [archaeon]HLD81416.1 30S ribosomal protein S27e [archaeon]